MNSERAGKYIQQTEEFSAFVPNPLPPDPPLVMDGELQVSLVDASLAVERLDSFSRTFDPDFPGFSDMAVRMFASTEATHSSQIEGTQSTLTEYIQLKREPGSSKRKTDADEIKNYELAMQTGLDLLIEIPLSSRLLRKVHAVLLEGVRGNNMDPGEFRRHQVHLGGGSNIRRATFVPPPANLIASCMSDLEKFIHSDHPIPLLIRTGMVHAQFELIHPFVDGNGRVGRLLIIFMLHDRGMLHRPWLYLSEFFNGNRAEYYDRLKKVSMEGDWEGWIRFFLNAVKVSANNVLRTMGEVKDLRESHRSLILSKIPSASALVLHDSLFKSPTTDLNRAMSVMGVSRTTASNTLNKLVELGILTELTGQSRNRLYLYKPLLKLFE